MHSMLVTSSCSSRAASSACLGNRASRIGGAPSLPHSMRARPIISGSRPSLLRHQTRQKQQLVWIACSATASSMGKFSSKGSQGPPEQVTRLFSVEEYEAAKEGKQERLSVVMCKAKSCRPCMAFSKKFYRAAERFKEKADFYEIYGDENKHTVKLMMDMKVKATPNFRFYRNGEEVHQHSGISEDKLVEYLEEFLGGES